MSSNCFFRSFSYPCPTERTVFEMDPYYTPQTDIAIAQ